MKYHHWVCTKAEGSKGKKRRGGGISPKDLTGAVSVQRANPDRQEPRRGRAGSWLGQMKRRGVTVMAGGRQHGKQNTARVHSNKKIRVWGSPIRHERMLYASRARVTGGPKR
jgi:hypothetical protein